MRNQPDALPPDLAQTLRGKAAHFGVPGLALALVGPDGRRALFTTGVEATGGDKPVTPDTWFSVASVGKHFTALAVLSLAQAGRLEIDAPLGRYLPGLPPTWSRRSISSLLHHTSGLPEYLAHAEADAVPTTRAEFLRQFGWLHDAFDEGDGWIYTNTNYILLGFLIAEVRGEPYAAALQALFDHAGCAGVTVASPQWARESNAASRGTDARDTEAWQREVIGDGDIALTARGALRWLEVLLGDALLSDEVRRAFYAPATLRTGRPSPYACGWFVDPFQSGTLVSHAGHFDGWTSLCLLTPEQGCGGFVMCNLAPGNTRAARELLQVALEAWLPGSTPRGLSPLTDDDPGLTATAQAQLLRPGGAAPNLDCFADELKRVAAHGSTVRNILNLWAGAAPQRFELVEQHVYPTHRLRRYRISYPQRTEHLLVGTTPEQLIYWAWPL